MRDEFGLNADEVSKANELVGNKLPPLVRPEILSFLFGISYGFLDAMARTSGRYYRIYQIPKHSTGLRQIEAPRRYLKIIQRWIYINILSTQQLPSAVTGFVRDKNIFSNAEPHKPNKNLMVIDIKKFFPSVRHEAVYRTFDNLGYPGEVSTLLTGLCTLRGRLPQGAPTSPSIANLVFRPLDLFFQDLAAEWDCSYTRYADDIAFSGNAQFSQESIEIVSNKLRESGFRINPKKTRIIGGSGRQILTGLVVNTSGLPPRTKRKRWRAMFHQASINPSKYIGQSQNLEGIASFINEYNHELYSEYSAIANTVSELEDHKS